LLAFSHSVWLPATGVNGPMMTDLAVVICPLMAFLLYYNTLQAGFVYDDK
jgi:hypothetical protein